MARLTDTQLVILSSASLRNDRGVDLPTTVTGEAVRKAVDRLIRTGLWLMFWAFLLTASWGLLLTMHWRTTPKERSEQ